MQVVPETQVISKSLELMAESDCALTGVCGSCHADDTSAESSGICIFVWIITQVPPCATVQMSRAIQVCKMASPIIFISELGMKSALPCDLVFWVHAHFLGCLPRSRSPLEATAPTLVHLLLPCPSCAFLDFHFISLSTPTKAGC